METINTTKKPSLLVILAVLGMIGFGVAATVAYLSLPTTVSADVKSPFDVKITETSVGTISEDGLSLEMGDIVGGSSYIVTATLENKANNPIPAKSIITCTDGVAPTCDVAVHHDNYVFVDGSYVYHEAGSYDLSCDNGVYTIQPGYEFPAGHKSKSVVTFVPASNYVGDLSCSVQAIPIVE